MSNDNSKHQGVGLFCGCLMSVIFALAFRPFDSADSAMLTCSAGLFIGWALGVWVFKTS